METPLRARHRDLLLRSLLMLLIATFAYGCSNAEFSSPTDAPLNGTGVEVVPTAPPPSDITIDTTPPATVPTGITVPVSGITEIPTNIVSVPRSFRDIVVYALGDSITTGFNASGFFLPALNLSWSAGSAIESHYVKTSRYVFGSDVSVFSENYAYTGGTILNDDNWDINTQSALVTANLDEDNLNYVTVLIGANDVCQQDLPDPTFKERVKERLEVSINRMAPYVDLILLSSVPNIDTVLNIASCPLPTSWRNWIQGQFCPNIDKLNPREIRRAVIQVNEALEEVALESPYDNIVFDDYTVYDTEIYGEQLSNLDCFHPNAVGQQDLSDALWPYAEDYFNRVFPVVW